MRVLYKLCSTSNILFLTKFPEDGFKTNYDLQSDPGNYCIVNYFVIEATKIINIASVSIYSLINARL